MQKEIDFKKFLFFLIGYVFFLSILMGVVFMKKNPFCSSNTPCLTATCTSCESLNEKKVCTDCSLFNEKEERIWVGSCIYEE